MHLWHFTTAHHHQSAVETSGGAGAGEVSYQVKNKKVDSLDPEADSIPAPHQSNRILSAQTRTLTFSVRKCFCSTGGVSPCSPVAMQQRPPHQQRNVCDAEVKTGFHKLPFGI